MVRGANEDSRGGCSFSLVLTLSFFFFPFSFYIFSLKVSYYNKGFFVW